MNTSRFLRQLFISKRILKHNGYQPISYSNIRFMTAGVYITQSSKARENFRDVLPNMIDVLLTSPRFKEVPEVGTWLQKVLDYNLAGGKNTRGLATVFAYEMLEKPDNINEETLRLSRIMGWCVEMLQTYFLVMDDIMDDSTTRRGVPCWYRNPGIGLGALNDALLILAAIFQTLKNFFKNSPHYPAMLDLFNEALLVTSMGQHLDFTMAHRSKDDYSLFTTERYNAIVKYKTAYYTFNLPVCLGLLLANITDKDVHRLAEDLCFDIGRFFQIQDDYIDCYGDESVTGKAGTDIQEGKCSWLAVTALKRCNPEQRAIFEQNYGKKEKKEVQRIKKLYEELEIKEIYIQKERDNYNRIVQRAKDLPANLTPLFLRIIEMLHKRKY